MEIFLIAGAIAYLTTVLVIKDGPNKIFDKFRIFLNTKLGSSNNPFNCMVCASFWISLFIVTLDSLFPDIARPFYTLFGILGIAMALRGASQEFS